MADLRPVYVAGDGDVKGPTSSSNNFLPLFADTTGKLLKSSGTGVTTQGLAILDDNTPAEQRNTIGLDQVNNTSDINKPVSTPQQKSLDLKANKIDLIQVNNTSDVNKPVSTAQQTALNSKMNLTGDGATPTFGAVSVNSIGLNPKLQGAYLLWNETGDGRTSLLNNQGKGIGGFIFRNVNKDFTAELGRVTIDGSGSLSSTGSITAAGNIYSANGAAALQADGNVNGSAWGGLLSTYIAKYVKSQVPLVATQALTNAGVDDATIVTPLKMRFGFNRSFGTNGFVVLPPWLGGFILQWGVIPAGTAVQSFPIAFPTAALNIQLTMDYDSSQTSGAGHFFGTLSTNAFTRSASYTDQMRYLVWGY